jgi:hypothetical protein
MKKLGQWVVMVVALAGTSVALTAAACPTCPCGSNCPCGSDCPCGY